MAGFCKLATSLQAPILGILRAKQPIVSGGRLKNSRFWETAAGDRVRSALRGPACSATRQILYHGRRQIGNAEPALLPGGRSRFWQLLRYQENFWRRS
jgi:hypothetical protein